MGPAPDDDVEIEDDAPSRAGNRPLDGVRSVDVLERIKELDLAHRNRLPPSTITGALSLTLVRQYLRRLVGQVERPVIEPIARPFDDSLLVGFVGHATCQLIGVRARVLVDLYLSDSLAGFRRPVGAVLHDKDLGDTTLCLITHGRPDRFHIPSLRRLPRTVAMVVPSGCGAKARAAGFRDVSEVAPGDDLVHRDLRISVVPVRNDGAGVLPLGWRSGHAFVIQGPEVAAFVAGPGGYFSGFSEIGRRLRPDVALLPIAGYHPDVLRSGNLSPLDAVYAFEDLRARLLVPLGYGAFPQGYEPLDEPLRWLTAACVERSHEAALTVLEPGRVLRVQRRK